MICCLSWVQISIVFAEILFLQKKHQYFWDLYRLNLCNNSNAIQEHVWRNKKNMFTQPIWSHHLWLRMLVFYINIPPPNDDSEFGREPPLSNPEDPTLILIDNGCRRIAKLEHGGDSLKLGTLELSSSFWISSLSSPSSRMSSFLMKKPELGSFIIRCCCIILLIEIAASANDSKSFVLLFLKNTKYNMVSFIIMND